MTSSPHRDGGSKEQQAASRLLRFIDAIDTEQKGVPARNPIDPIDPIDPEDPFRPVFDAVAQMKKKLDASAERIEALELAHQEIANRLQQSRKLDAVNTMAGGVAHHFNNLLMVIMGNLELMRLEVPEESRLISKIDTLEDSARRAADLSTLLLTYVGQTRIVPEVIDLNATLSDMSGVLHTVVSDKAGLFLEPSGESAWIYADPSKVYEVITNLVNNALEAPGAQPLEIRISTGRRFCETPELGRLAPGQNIPEGHYVWLCIADNGRGMSPETLEKVFDPFFTTKFTGRGLGMAAVIGIMRAHQGGVHVGSRPDDGTAVTVYFPETKHTVRPLAVKEEDDPSGGVEAQRRGTILLVEDEHLVLELGKEMLGFMEFDVLTATDGLEALALFDANPGRIDMVVLDINMPRMGGRDTIKRLRDRGATFPILVASGYTDAQSREKMGDVTVDGFIQKPFRLEEFKKKINALFGSPER